LGEFVAIEQMLRFGVYPLPSVAGVGARRNTQAYAQIRRRGLHDLGQIDSRHVVDLDREWRNRDLFTAFGRKPEDLCGAALDADRGSGIAARTRIRLLQDAVAETVCDCSPGETGTGRKSASTGLCMVQSPTTCSHPSVQL
jgi:hypothetical protein